VYQSLRRALVWKSMEKSATDWFPWRRESRSQAASDPEAPNLNTLRSSSEKAWDDAQAGEADSPEEGSAGPVADYVHHPGFLGGERVWLQAEE